MSAGQGTRREPESGGARDNNGSGRQPKPGGDRGLDWELFDALLNDTAPASLRAALIPSDQRPAYVSALLNALPPDATYTRPMEGGETWKGKFSRKQRLSAIHLLGALRDKRAAKPLVAQLHDPSNHVRIAIIMALGWIGGPVAVEALSKTLKHSHEATRNEAARWLGWIGDQAARDSLAEALFDGSTATRVAAARSLAKLDDPRAFGPLVEAFWGQDGVDQDHILDELIRFDEGRTVRILIQGRGSQDSKRFEAATRALRRLGTTEALTGLEKYQHRARANFDDF